MARLNACLECGKPIPASPDREFCGSGCRQKWNNRRMQRGAALLDLYMAHRFDRTNAQALGVFQAINRLASEFRRQDAIEREGRRSWRQTQAVLAERPYLKAIRGRV